MIIVEYKKEWPQNFEKIKRKLYNALIGLQFNIEHVGSTSIEGLAAKEIIDIDIIYRESFEFEKIKSKLEELGYYHNGDQGIIGREVFKRSHKIYDEVLDKINHHLYLCKFDCVELQRHILFRDYLRNSLDARLFYQELKYQMAAEANNDRKIYANLKELKANSFINYLIELQKKQNNTTTNR